MAGAPCSAQALRLAPLAQDDTILNTALASVARAGGVISLFPVSKQEMTALKPQDLVVLLRLATPKGRYEGSHADLARSSGISPGELTKSLQRSEQASLYDSSQSAVRRGELTEFVVHGVRYAFPATRGPVGRGVPTSIAAHPLRDAFAGAGEDPLRTPVWPYPEGDTLGYAIEPLYRTVPNVAPKLKNFYALLALTDALREGRARERNLAADLIRTRISL